MNRETFLNELMAGLTQLGPVEQRQVADYYNELIFDGVENGKPEEEIIAGFGAPEEIAAQIRVEYKSQQAVEGAPGQGAVPPRPACLEYPAQEPVHTVMYGTGWTCCAGRMTSHWSCRWTLPARYASKHATPVSRSRAFQPEGRAGL